MRAVKNPLGHPMPDFDTPWKRLVWILTGRNQYPTIPIPADLRAGLATSVEAFFILFLFELGPIAGLLALVGLVTLSRRDRAFTAILVLAFVIAVTFASFLQSRAMLHIFLLPAMVLMTLAVGSGVEAAVGRMPGATRALVAVALAALMIVPGPFIREYAEAHPFTKWKFHVEEEDLSLRASWFPTMRSFRDADRYRAAAVAAIPESALVLAGWSELNVLRYAQAVRGERKDLTLQQITPETLPQRMGMWQRTHDVTTHPFVFTELPSELPPMLRSGGNASWHAVLERIPLDWERVIYIQRGPIDTSGRSPFDRLAVESRAPTDLVIRVTLESFERSMPGFIIRLRDRRRLAILRGERRGHGFHLECASTGTLLPARVRGHAHVRRRRSRSHRSHQRHLVLRVRSELTPSAPRAHHRCCAVGDPGQHQPKASRRQKDFTANAPLVAPRLAARRVRGANCTVRTFLSMLT